MNEKNIKTFFACLEKFQNLENRNGRDTYILIYKTALGYNLYFGLASNNHKELSKLINGREEVFKENYQNLLVPNSGVFLASVSEEELNGILYAYNMKYSVTTSPTLSTYEKEDFIRFRTHPGLEVKAQIFISPSNAPASIEEHIKGTKDKFFKLESLKTEEKYQMVKLNSTRNYQDYITMLKLINANERKNPIRKAYNFTPNEFLEYSASIIQRKIPAQKDIEVDFENALDFIRR